MFNSIITFLNTHTPLLYLTQSLWRDEAFSFLVAQPGGIQTIQTTANDYNPPLYYLILHFWMKLFGSSEISLRMLSFVFYLALIYVFLKFAKLLFKGKWPYITTLLLAVNPMLLYYGLEARMYSLYAFLTTASMYFFYVKKWKPYILITTLALYTQPYTIFVPLTQGLYLLITKKLNKKTLLFLAIPFLLYLPWIWVIFQQFRNSKEMWIYPINWNLILSVLGNLYTGYEGTPGFLWGKMKLLSLILLLFFLIAVWKKENFKKNLLFLLWVFVPLTVVLAVSYFKPVFVNRYVITVTVAEIFLLMLGITSLKSQRLKAVISVLFFCFSLYLLVFLPPYIKKVDIRKSFSEINNLEREDDIVLARSPLVFFESLYYSKERSKVFLYNPEKVRLPGYLGIILIPAEKQLAIFPPYPKRAFMIFENGSFEVFSGFPY